MSNVESAKLFFGVVLDRLQGSFPAAVHLRSDDLWPDFESLAKDCKISVKDSSRAAKMISVEDAAKNEKTKAHYMKLMLCWMADEGYLHSDPTSHFPYDYVLSSKALAVLDISLTEEKTTLGAALARATGRMGDTVQSEVVSKLVDRVFEAAQGISA